MTKSMRSWRVVEHGEPASLQTDDIEAPEPGELQSVIQLEAAALNFSDLLMIRGQYQVKPPLPFTPGQEVAGTVIRAGTKSRFSVGDRLASKVEWGGFADEVLVEDHMALSMPEGISLEKAVALPVVYTTAHIALHHRGGLQAGETVLVHAAAGGTGLAAVQLAKAAGATVIATAGSPEKTALAQDHGADVAVLYTSDDWPDRVREASGGKGADIVFDPVGGEVAEQSLKCLAWGGRHLIIGFSAGAVPKFPAHRLLLKNASAVGVYWSHENDPDLVAHTVSDLLEKLSNGVIDPVIDTRFTVSQLKEALAALDGRRTAGKVVLRKEA